jgi:hypothetical protein
LKPEARAGSRKSASSLQVTLVFGAEVLVGWGITVAVEVSVAAGGFVVTGAVVAAGADVATEAVGVDDMLQANIRMDKSARGTTRRFIKTFSFFIDAWINNLQLASVQGKISFNLFHSSDRRIVCVFANCCHHP